MGPGTAGRAVAGLDVAQAPGDLGQRVVPPVRDRPRPSWSRAAPAGCRRRPTIGLVAVSDHFDSRVQSRSRQPNCDAPQPYFVEHRVAPRPSGWPRAERLPLRRPAARSAAMMRSAATAALTACSRRRRSALCSRRLGVDRACAASTGCSLSADVDQLRRRGRRRIDDAAHRTGVTGRSGDGRRAGADDSQRRGTTQSRAAQGSSEHRQDPSLATQRGPDGQEGGRRRGRAIRPPPCLVADAITSRGPASAIGQITTCARTVSAVTPARTRQRRRSGSTVPGQLSRGQVAQIPEAVDGRSDQMAQTSGPRAARSPGRRSGCARSGSA